METMKLQKGDYLIHCGDEMKQIHIVVRGSMRMESAHDRFLVPNGSIIGLLECSGMAYNCDYYAEEDSIIVAYPFQSIDDFKQIFEENQEYAFAFFHSAIVECMQLIERYLTLAAWLRKHGKTPTEDIEVWEILYYKSLQEKDTNLLSEMYGKDNNLCIGEILRASDFMSRVIDGINEMLDNAECSLEEVFGEGTVEKAQAETNACEENVTESEDQEQTVNAEEGEQGVDCLQTILRYARQNEKDIELVREKITEFRNLPDIYSTDDDVRRLRRELTAIFFQIYEKVFFRAAEEGEPLDEIIQMFLNFGFMDVKLAGAENADALYGLTEHLQLCNSNHVYTIYEWLLAVYEGKKEPSRNEFDMDYSQYLRDQMKNGNIRKEELAALSDDLEEKVKFEIRNMFQSTNRATYGRYATYCPILRKEDLTTSVTMLLTTVAKIDEALKHVTDIDYSCFYRSMYVADPAHNLPKQEVKYELFPDVILMPNCGCKAMMWQEAAGARGEFPARFVLPILNTGSVEDMILECCGRFRWEMCRRIQGMRWNDIRENSLTAEYCDYLQFYRKNHNLTAEAREKIKGAIVKAKNNFREVFVADYVAWIKYESQGSVRLNKVARDIVFRYCPFSKSIRNKLKESPMYRDMIGKFEILNDREAKKVQNAFARYEKSGGEFLPEMDEYLKYFEL